jgi:heat shock protein HtpX
VTVGAVQQLSRDELQGVIAHEFGHIFNGDTLISMRLAAMVMGFYFVLYIALRMIQFSGFRGRNERRSEGGGSSSGNGGNLLVVAALILAVAGALTWLMGSILKCMVSRQREYLADASSVQYTRNPKYIADALRKIAGLDVHDMPASGMAFSHMYFDDSGGFLSSIFATHPPIEKRIAALEGKPY